MFFPDDAVRTAASLHETIAEAVGMFSTTLSFLLTTPGVWEASAGGFPALSVVPGQFLIKDVVLLGASLWMFSQDWRVQRIA